MALLLIMLCFLLLIDQGGGGCRERYRTMKSHPPIAPPARKFQNTEGEHL